MAIKVRNLRNQVIPIQHTASSGLRTYMLKKREIVVMEDSHLSQDLVDKSEAPLPHITITDTDDSVTDSQFN